MKQSINIRSEQLMQNIVSLINNSNLPISNVYFIFKNIMQDIENTYYSVLNQESEEYTEKTDGSEILGKDLVDDIAKTPEEALMKMEDKENEN